MSKPPVIDTHALEALLRDIYSELYGAAKFPIDAVTAKSLSDRTLSAIVDLVIYNRDHPPG